MNCIVHNHAEAAGTCGMCGAGLCPVCFSSSFYTWDGKPLCPSCNVTLVRNLAAEAHRDILSGIFRVSFYVAIWSLAIYLFRTGGENWEALVFWGGIGAFPTAWRMLKPSFGHEFVNDVEAYGNGNLFPWLFSLCFRFFGALVLGAVLSPIFLFVAAFQLVRASLLYSSFKRDLALMEAAGYPVRVAAEERASPPDRRLRRALARRREAMYFGHWKRNARQIPPAAVAPRAEDSAAAETPQAEAAAESATPVRPVVPEDRIASRMAAIDARIAARMAALDSGTR